MDGQCIDFLDPEATVSDEQVAAVSGRVITKRERFGFLDVAKAYVYAEMVKAGNAAAVKIGGGFRISRTSVYQWSKKKVQADWVKRVNQDLDPRGIKRERNTPSKQRVLFDDVRWIAEILADHEKTREIRGDKRSFGLRKQAKLVRAIAESTTGKRHLKKTSHMMLSRHGTEIRSHINSRWNENGEEPVSKERIRQFAGWEDESGGIRASKKRRTKRIAQDVFGGDFIDRQAQAQLHELSRKKNRELGGLVNDNEQTNEKSKFDTEDPF